MMQEDSNGESTFEFVDKKATDLTLSKNESFNSLPSSASLVHIPSGGNLLSNVAPPSALPSFVAAQQVAARPLGAPSTAITPSHAFHTTSFSPVIPPSNGGDTTPVAPVEEASPVGDGPSSLFGWVRGAVGTSGGIFSRVAEKAKSSVDSMITTLDPQMREFLHSGGDIDIIVASEKEVKISPIREAFQAVFGKATVSGMPADVSVTAAQPVGFASGVKAAEERILVIRSASTLYQRHPVLAIENFIVEVEENKWYDLGVLILSDPSRGINLQTFTQMTPVPTSFVAVAKEDTPSDYLHISSGYSVTIGSLMASNLHVHHGEWHEAYTGVSRREMLLVAAKTLAGIYKTSIASSIL